MVRVRDSDGYNKEWLHPIASGYAGLEVGADFSIPGHRGSRGSCRLRWVG